jgi:hypothetical protein
MSAKLTADQDDVAINGDLTRYRALLKISGTVGAQPAVDAVLHSLAILLSNAVELRELRNKLHVMKPQRRTSCVSTSRTFAHFWLRMPEPVLGSEGSLVRPQTHEMRKCDFGGDSFSVFLH